MKVLPVVPELELIARVRETNNKRIREIVVSDLRSRATDYHLEKSRIQDALYNAELAKKIATEVPFTLYTVLGYLNCVAGFLDASEIWLTKGISQGLAKGERSSEESSQLALQFYDLAMVYAKKAEYGFAVANLKQVLELLQGSHMAQLLCLFIAEEQNGEYYCQRGNRSERWSLGTSNYH